MGSGSGEGKIGAISARLGHQRDSTNKNLYNYVANVFALFPLIFKFPSTSRVLWTVYDLISRYHEAKDTCYKHCGVLSVLFPLARFFADFLLLHSKSAQILQAARMGRPVIWTPVHYW